MDWVAISALSDVVGTILVVLSLLFVAVQLRQNTKAIIANSRQGVLDADIGLISDFMTHSLDPHLVGDDVKLSPEDERKFTWLIIKALRIRESAWHQYKSGTLDEESWQSYMAPVAGIFSTKRSKVVLDFYTGSDEFMKLIRQRVGDVKV